MKKKIVETTTYKILLLIYLSVAIFFPIGLYALLSGPTKWIAEAALKNSWAENTEKVIQRFTIIGLAIIALFLARIIQHYFSKKGSAIIKWSIFAFLTAIFLSSVYVFSFKPEFFISLSGNEMKIQSQSMNTSSGVNIEFVFGAYPSVHELKRLKAAGYAGVVSLLNELVVPAEPELIKQEEANAKLAGIELVRIPMLPWVSGNNTSIEQIRQLVKTKQGKYFVHCYLGRDRVNVFRKIVRDMGAKNTSLIADNARHIDELKRFERGAYFKLKNHIYLTPFPTDDEFFGYFVNGQIGTVVSLLNPADKEDTVWIAREEKILSRYGVRYINIPVVSKDDKVNIKRLIDSLGMLKKPLVIHKYSSSDPIYNELISIINKK